MATLVVIAVVVILIVAAGSGGDRDVPGDEQLRRDEEDIAIYGAIVRPPIEDDRRPVNDDRP